MCGGWEACSWKAFMFGRMTAQVYQNVGRKSFGVSVQREEEKEESYCLKMVMKVVEDGFKQNWLVDHTDKVNSNLLDD